jgi:hypothetical protein
MNGEFGRVRAILAGVLGILLVLGLLVAGFVAALVLVPLAVIVFLIVRHRLRTRMAEVQAGTWQRQGADIEGVVIDVQVEEPDQPSLGRQRD